MHLGLAAFAGRNGADRLDNLPAVIEQTQKNGTASRIRAGAAQRRLSGARRKKRGYRAKACAAGVPVFDEIPEMAKALSIVGLSTGGSRRNGVDGAFSLMPVRC